MANKNLLSLAESDPNFSNQALENAINSNKILNGNLIGLHAIGGGLSWGASIIRIGKPKNL